MTFSERVIGAAKLDTRVYEEVEADRTATRQAFAVIAMATIAEIISRTRLGAGLVVLSGCHSGEGEALPGTGLVGLTRAWLTAGARAVIASNWSTPDASGALFGALYRHLRAHPDVAPSTALRAAQLEMMRSGGWQSNPRYWGAYFAVGAR